MGAPSTAARVRPETADRRPPARDDAPEPLHRALPGELVAPGTNRHAGRAGGDDPAAVAGHPDLPGAHHRGGGTGDQRGHRHRGGPVAGPPRPQAVAALLRSVEVVRKESLAPAGTGPFFLLAPVVSFACFLTVPLLIPVLTSYGAAVGVYRRHPRWGVHSGAGQFPGRGGGRGNWRGVRAARVQPVQDVRRDHRTGGAAGG